MPPLSTAGNSAVEVKKDDGMTQRVPLRSLSELPVDQECDAFALLSQKEEGTTREGKPYWMVTFRDATMQYTFPIWCDSPLAEVCRHQWTVGTFYKLRAVRRETKYGPQLEIRRIREVAEHDYEDGFDPLMCLPQSRVPPRELFERLRTFIESQVRREDLRNFLLALLDRHENVLLTLPAARMHHHAFVGGWLEHTLSVVESCAYLADKYITLYPDLKPPLDRDLVIAGGVVHDIGKIKELRMTPTVTEYTEEGALLGHTVLGRDIIREAVGQTHLDPETQLRLEHIVLSHQRLPEWGSPKPPMTPEALIVHYADDLDAKFQMFYQILQGDAEGQSLTSDRNILRQRVFRGLNHETWSKGPPGSRAADKG